MARRRHAALALVVGLMAGVTNRGLAQAASRSRFSAVKRQHLAGPADPRAGIAGPPTLGPYNVTLEVALEPLFRAPFLVRSSSNLSARSRSTRCSPSARSSSSARESSTGSATFQEQIRPVPGPQLAEAHQSHAQRERRPVHAAADIHLEQPGRHPAAGAVDVRDHHHQHGERTDQAVHRLNDTTFVSADPLEACTSYRWSVHANMVNGPASDQITANSPGTFVIQTSECPTATLLYQNFPNPFGGGLQPNTCFWFDLAHRANVSLNVYDLAGATCARSSPACCRRSSTPEPTAARAGPRADATRSSSGTGATPPGATRRPASTSPSSPPTDFARHIKILYRGP